MANPSAPNPNASGPVPSHEVYDELSGVYGFFRRHQKKILYTAGLFTLLTFSIAQQLQDSVRNVAVSSSVRGTIQVNGKAVDVLDHDIEVGHRVAIGLQPRRVEEMVGGQRMQSLRPPAVPGQLLPQISGGDSEE